MQDFNDYVNGDSFQSNGGDNNGYNDIMNMVKGLAGKFDGKNQNELMRAIYEHAKKGKKEGTLKNSDIDNFAKMLAPMLDGSQKKLLYRVVNELKKI